MAKMYFRYQLLLYQNSKLYDLYVVILNVFSVFVLTKGNSSPLQGLTFPL